MWRQTTEFRANYRLPCKSLVNRKARVLCTRSGERAVGLIKDRLLHTYASRLVVPASSRTGHPFAASGSEEPSQMIEFVFSASLETIRSGPPEFDPSPVANRRDLAVCASMNPDVFAFPLLGKVFYAAAVGMNSSAGKKSCFLRSTASM